MDHLLSYIQAERRNMLAMLRTFVAAESPSTDKVAVDHFCDSVGEAASDLNGRVRFYRPRKAGNHLKAEFRINSARTAGQILLLGHLDTVWEVGTIARMPFRVDGDRAYGPGVFDMKAGIVSGLFALKALQTAGVSVKKKIVFLLTADEEIGSRSSRPITESVARCSDFVLVLEPAHGLKGALKTARKGVGEFEIHVKGKSAHAGLEPEKGASATVELCRQILRLQELADPPRGITLNAGIVRGGSRANVIAADAIAEMDVRVTSARDVREIERKFRTLKPFDQRTTVEITGGFNRPPMERTAQSAKLFERARRLARPLGIELIQASVGGASDGNFTAALGVPTLDGLGAVGEGAHSADEHIILAELPRRTALLAHLIADLGNA